MPALTGAFLAGAAAAATVRWWWPRLERLDGRVQAWVEARRRARVDFLVRDAIRDGRPEP